MDLLAYAPDEPSFMDSETVITLFAKAGVCRSFTLRAWIRSGYLCEKVVAYVGGCWRGIINHEAHRIMSLAILCRPPFIDFVEQRRPRALPTLAHHFAMAQVADDH